MQADRYDLILCKKKKKGYVHVLITWLPKVTTIRGHAISFQPLVVWPLQFPMTCLHSIQCTLLRNVYNPSLWLQIGQHWIPISSQLTCTGKKCT